jgi:uncharacterized membrane protein YedE/YeeE
MLSSYLQSLAGGALIGLAAGALLLLTGRIAGVSGIAAGVLAPGEQADRTWRLLFLAGLIAGGLVIAAVSPGALAWTVPRSWPALAVAGILVGAGTSLANGCTSGHGVCGIGRLSPRSLVATGVFMAVAMITTAVVTHAARGAL